MPNNPFDSYEQKAKEEQMVKSVITYILTVIRAGAFKFDNDALLRISKGIQTEMTRLVAEAERNGSQL